MTKLSQILAKKFEEEFDKVFEAEKADKTMLPKENFESSIDRAKAGIDLATDRIVKDLAYVIALHREEIHKEDTTEEQASLLADGADPEMGTMSFWSE